MKDIFKRIDELPPNKRALLLKKVVLQQKQAQSAQTNLRGLSQNVAPLSFAQEQIWLLEQIKQGIAAYHVPLSLRLRGELRVPELERSLTTIIDRHESLRTTFELVAGKPMQIIAPSQPWTLSVIDLKDIPAEDRELALSSLAEREALRPFDLARGPLIRALLVRMDVQDHAMLIFIHHIVADGSSARLLWQELSILYPSFCANTPASLPEIALQYADFAIQQRSQNFMEKGLAYWQEQLEGVQPLELPTDYVRPPLQTFNGQHISLQMPLDLTQQMKQLAQSEQMTLFMALVGSFSLLLARYSGQNDITVGTPVTMRNDVRLEALIGLFVNTVVLRMQIPPTISCRAFLQRVRQLTLEAYQYQDTPLSKIIESVQPERDANRSPLFQTMFSLQSAQPGDPVLGDLQVSLLEYQNLTTKYDLSISVVDHPEGFLAIAEYNSDLFAPATMQTMLHHWQRILEEIVRDPAQSVWELPLLSSVEMSQVLFGWNNTAITWPSPLLHEMFESQVSRTPDARALLFEGKALTYQELNNYANQVARALLAREVGPETLVGLYIERSPEMIIGLLGILKAGAAYIPLDPTYPVQRLTFMIENAQLSLLLTTKALYADFFYLDVDLLCIDESGFLRSDISADNLHLDIVAANIAYVIYTSGSTGTPKGIAISHQALHNFGHSMLKLFSLTTDDTLLAVTSLSFDISILEIFVPLVQGATVHIAAQDAVADGARLLSLLEQEGAQASIMQATPVTWQLLLSHGWSGQRNLKMVCGGEALPPVLAQALLAQSEELWNMYGPTETTVWSTAACLKEKTTSISIGTPIGNTSIYILDSYLQPVPIGVTGEFWIGGTGLARGYLGQPDLTADRFRPNPFSEQGGERIYRTGDLARYRMDGSIECLGRIDHQVKIRGFRIELNEIETILLQYPDVQACVVTLRKEHQDQARIIAYLKLQPEASLVLNDLYSHLQYYLPAYMLPAAIAVLDEFPLTPNKKIDRHRLPTTDITFFEQRGEYIAPTTELEEQLVQIWREVLGIEKIGIHDDFFALGGDSLSSIYMISKLHEIGISVQPKHLHNVRTVAQLAELVGTFSESE